MTGLKLNLNKREEVLSKVENLMLRGSERPTEIAKAVGCSNPQAKRYKEAILTRWSLSTLDKEAKRKELVRCAEEIYRASWDDRNRAKTTNEKTGALRTALTAIERIAKLMGIDVDTSVNLNLEGEFIRNYTNYDTNQQGKPESPPEVLSPSGTAESQPK